MSNVVIKVQITNNGVFSEDSVSHKTYSYTDLWTFKAYLSQRLKELDRATDEVIVLQSGHPLELSLTIAALFLHEQAFCVVDPHLTATDVQRLAKKYQLGMIWDDINTHGTLSKDTSAWFAHINTVKGEIDKSGTLESDISATQTEITVLNADTLDWPSTGFVMIDDDVDIASLEDRPPEYVLYNGIEGNVLKNCVRGAWHAQSNPARAHLAGHVVNLFKPQGGPDAPAWEVH